MNTDGQIQALLEDLARDRRADLGTGDPPDRVWLRAQVISHDAANGRLLLRCFMSLADGRPLEPGELVIVAAAPTDDPLQSAAMRVEHSSGGPEALLQLIVARAWQPHDERRHQVRLQLRMRPTRARRWFGGAWRAVGVLVVDISSRGVGLRLDQEVRLGDRLSLQFPLSDGQADLRVTVEIRHVRPARPEQSDPDAAAYAWRAGGLFRGLPSDQHERVIRFIFAELGARQA